MSISDAVNTAISQGNVSIYSPNVTNYDDIPALFQTIVQELGGLDLIIYNAGVQPALPANGRPVHAGRPTLLGRWGVEGNGR